MIRRFRLFDIFKYRTVKSFVEKNTRGEVIEFRMTFLKFLSHIVRRSRLLLVAFEGQEIIGLAMCRILGRESALEVVLVDKEYRRRGIGTLLLNKMISILQNMNVRLIRLSILEENIVGRKFYEKNGFKPVRRRIEYIKEI